MEKQEVLTLLDKGVMLPLMEEFYTIQGERFSKGTAAYLYIRVGGCDVVVHWCDVKELECGYASRQ
jgi:organic radical activating enzyme